MGSNNHQDTLNVLSGTMGQHELIGAIDQGTSSTRFLVFENRTGQLIASSQVEIQRIVPKEGWVEIDPNAIMSSVYKTVSAVHEQLTADMPANSTMKNSTNLKCIGICNQRESTVVWDSKTGQALYNVIVWMDNRTKDLVDDMIDSVPGRDFNWLKDKTGLPMSTYFSAFKLKWLIDNVESVKLALKEGRLMFGTVDSWILWNLTGNHLTDVTNASRTFLMDIESLQWDKTLCKQFNIPMNILPKILASADDFGTVQHGPLKGLPITGVIGDQSAALFGHNCLQLGQTKATFGTGCFIMQNIGPGPLSGAMSGVQREAKRGLVTTVGFKLRDAPATYALEGSIKIAGAALTWLRDNMQLIEDYSDCDQLVNQTTHSAGVFFVPALGGLYSPYWDPNAAGLFIGLSQFSRREHLVRATFDAIAFQTNDILSLMRGNRNGLMIDGGLCKSDNMCQILADITGIDIVRPSMCETSALGAAMVAGCGAGIWSYEEMVAMSHTRHDDVVTKAHTCFVHANLENEKARAQYEDAVETKRAQYDGVVANLHTRYDDVVANPHGQYDLDDDDDEGTSSPTCYSDYSSSSEQTNNHYPPTESLQYEEKFSSLIHSIYFLYILSIFYLYSFSLFEDEEKQDGLYDQHQEHKQQVEKKDSITSQPSYEHCEVCKETCNQNLLTKPVDIFQSYISLEHREELVETWRAAVERSMQWTKVHHEEIRRIDYQRLSSLPISMYVFFSIGMVALSGVLSSNALRGFLS